MVSDYLNRHNISSELSAEVRYYCQFVLSVEMAQEKAEDALRILPRKMKIQVMMETRTSKVNWHQLERNTII